MTRAVLLLAPVLLGGCISLLPEPPPPPRIFVLEAGDVARAQAGPVDAVVAVATPSGERSILGSELGWRTGDELAFVAQTQWSSRADTALQSLVVDTLVREQRFHAAVRSGEARADYEVRWEVLDFEVDSVAMRARFVADVKLIDTRTRRIMAQNIISAEAPVADRSASVAAQALAAAARSGAGQISVFAADAAARATDPR